MKHDETIRSLGKQLPNLGRFDDPLLPSGKVPLLQQTMKLATSGVFKAIYGKSKGPHVLLFWGLFSIVNIKVSLLVSFQTLFCWYSYVQEMSGELPGLSKD